MSGIGAVMGIAIEGSAALLDGAGVDQPGLAAETLVRLVVFAVLNNETTVDHDDPARLDAYARAVVHAFPRRWGRRPPGRPGRAQGGLGPVWVTRPGVPPWTGDAPGR